MARYADREGDARGPHRPGRGVRLLPVYRGTRARRYAHGHIHARVRAYAAGDAHHGDGVVERCRAGVQAVGRFGRPDVLGAAPSGRAANILASVHGGELIRTRTSGIRLSLPRSEDTVDAQETGWLDGRSIHDFHAR